MSNIDIIIRAQNLASSALRSVERDLQGLSRQGNIAQQGFGGLQRAVGVGMLAAAGAATAGIAALGAGLARSATVAADFESQINILTVAARASGTTMDDLSAAALRVGSDTELVGISASEAADAMTNFYKAGLTTSDIFSDLNGYLEGSTSLTGALRAAVDLAAASKLDLAAASDVVAIAMATFGLKAEDAARIANTLVGAADASLASVGGLAEGMQNVGPVAAAMGMSLEDVSTALAILSTRGIQGSEAGTAMRSMLLNLQRPTKAVTEALDELGVSLYNTDGTMKALPDVIGQLESAFAGLTEEQKNQYAQTLAGTYGLAAFNTLIGEGATGWDEMTTAIGNAATAQEVAQARTKGFNAAIEQFHGTLETFMITVGTPLIQSFLTPAAVAMTELIGKLTEMAPTVEQVEQQYRNLVAQGSALIDSIMAVIGPIVDIVAQYVEWQDVLIALGIVIASAVIPALVGIVTAAAPVIAVGAALVAAVALVRTAWEEDWGGIQEKTATVMTWLVDAYTVIADWMTNDLPLALETLRRDWTLIWNAIQSNTIAIVGVITGTLNAIAELVNVTIPNAIDGFKSFLSRISLPNPFALISSTISGISSAVDSAKSAIDSFKSWLSSIKIPNPFSGFSLPSIPNPFSNASGTGFFPGGVTLVGERGPELVALPRGSRIESSERTERMMGGGVTVNVYATVNNGMDIEELAWRVASTIQRRGR